jgi:hypothetical protein
LRLMETMTPETEYCGFTADSPLTSFQLVIIFNFCMQPASDHH